MLRRDDTPAAPKGAEKKKLTASERAVFDEALARGEAARKSAESGLVELGQWLFAQVFGGDSSAVIDSRDDNALWAALVEAADGPRLRLTPALLESALLCAVYDKRLNSDGWRAIDFTRKAMLLRLRDEKLMRSAAQHLLATNLSIASTGEYVRELLRANGEEIQTRVTLRRVGTQVARLTDRLVGEEFNDRLDEVIADADDDERRAALAQVERAQDALGALKKKLSGRAPRKTPRKKPKRKR
jgi:hypothetical protein